MQIYELTTPLFEVFADSIENKRLSQQHGIPWVVDIWKNPTKQELDRKMNMQKYHDVRAFLVGKDMFAWNTTEALHYEVFSQLFKGQNAKSVIPIVFAMAGNEAYAMVTDFSRNTIWNHNPAVVPAIKNHPHIRRLVDDVEVDFYDEAIVGSWDKNYA